jgi:hypothetical protein
VEDTSSGVVCLAAAVLTVAAAFFFDFPAAELKAAENFGTGFFGLAVSLVVITLGCLCASVTVLGEEFVNRFVGEVVALKLRRLG